MGPTPSTEALASPGPSTILDRSPHPNVMAFRCMAQAAASSIPARFPGIAGAAGYGLDMDAGGTVTNTSTGYITGGEDGIIVNGAAGNYQQQRANRIDVR